MSHQIGSRTPRRDTYVGLCLYEEEEEEEEGEEGRTLVESVEEEDG